MLHAAVQFPNLRLIEAHYHIYLQDFRRGSISDPLEGVTQWDSLVYTAADLPQHITFRSYFLLASLLLSPLPLHHTRHPDRAADVADTERSGTFKDWQVPQNYKIEYSVTTAPDTMPDDQKYNGFDLETWKVWDSPQWNGSKMWQREKRRLSRRLESP